MLRTSFIKATSPFKSIRVNGLTTRNLHVSSCRKEHHLNATPELFDKHVLKAPHGDRLVLVDFYAEYVNDLFL